MWLRLGGRTMFESCWGPDDADSLPPLHHGRAGRWVGRRGHSVKGMRLAGRALPHGMGPAQAGPRCWECPCHRPHHDIRLRTGQPPGPGSAEVLCVNPCWDQPLCSESILLTLLGTAAAGPLLIPLFQEAFPWGSSPAPRALSPLSGHKRVEPGYMCSALRWAPQWWASSCLIAVGMV